MVEEIDKVDESLYDLDDDALEAAFQEAKASMASPEVGIEDAVDEEDETVEVTTEEEIEVDELEQPEDQDSDDDTSDDVEDGEESEDDSEEVNGEPDEELDTTEEQTAKEEVKSEPEPQPVQKLKVKANGQDFEFTEQEMKEQFGKVFGQAMDYTKKMQQIKPYRKMIDAWEQEKLTQDDLNLAIDVLKGDKDAIAAVVKKAGIDTLDLETEGENNYVPNDYGRNEAELAFKDVIGQINNDPEYVTTEAILTKQWDQDSWATMSDKPEMIKGLHEEVQMGRFAKVNAEAQKMKLLDGGRSGSDLDYYFKALDGHLQEERANADAQTKAEQLRVEQERIKAEAKRIEDVRAKEAQRKNVAKAKVKRKAAVPAQSRTGTNKHTDYLDESDEAFEEWYNKLQGSM